MEKALKSIYQEQAKDIKSAIVELYADMLTDGEISTTNLYRYGRYINLLKKINKITDGTASLQIDLMQNSLENAYIDAFDKTSDELGQSIS